MPRPAVLLAASVLAAVFTMVRCAPASAQGFSAQPGFTPAGLELSSRRPLHWELQTKAEPALNEIPQNAYLSFYITGAVLMVLGSSLAVYSTVHLYDAVQRVSTGDQVTHGMAVGAETLLSLVGLAFVILGTVLHSDQSAPHRAPAAGTVRAMLGPGPNGSGAFGALTVTF